MSQSNWVVYLVRCLDDSFYCGITNNLNKRVAAHNSGKGAKYTRSRRPVVLAAASTEMTKSDALKMEYRIKRVSADQKIIELKKGKVKTTMDLKKELQKVNEKISALSKMVDKLISAAETPVKAKPKSDPKKPVKKTVAKKSTTEKPVAKKTPTPKAPLKKPSKKSVAEGKTIEKTSTGTAVDTVLGIIKESKNGINTALLMEKTGFNEKKIQNLVFKLKKQGKVKNVDRGMYGIA